MMNLALFLEDAPVEAPEGGGAQTLILMGGLFAIFYFMMIRPQQKEQKRRQAMLDSLAKNDKVITTGGLHGTIVNVNETEVTLKVDDNVKLKFSRSAIAGKAEKASAD